MKHIFALAVACLCGASAWAQTGELADAPVTAVETAAGDAVTADDKDVKTVVVQQEVRVINEKDSAKAKRTTEIVKGRLKRQPIEDERVIVGKDTINVIIPERNYGRYDRGLFNYLFIPRKHWMFGISASWGKFESEDLSILKYVKDLDLEVSTFSVNPSAAYFFKSNQCVGLRFTYQRSSLDLDNLAVDFDDDINFTLADVKYHSQTYSAAAFYRHYLGLDNSRRFAVFNEVAASFGGGHSRFLRSYNNEPRDTKSDDFEMRLNFSPGLCVFMMENISFDVSFGVFGWYITHSTQMTNGVDEGKRNSSGANFRFNIFNINFGMAIHI